jgi:hypothetical protein
MVRCDVMFAFAGMYAHGTSELRTMYPSEQGKDFQGGSRRSDEASGLPGVPDTKRMRM